MQNQLLNLLGKIKLGALLPYIIIGCAFWYLTNQKSESDKHMIELVNAMQDTVKVHVDKYGDKVYQISQIRTTDPKVFLNLKTNDAEIKRLQEEVAKYKNQLNNGGSVTIFNSSVKVDTTLTTTVMEGGVMASASDGEWYSVDNFIVPDGKSTTSLKVKNDYTVAIVEEGGKSVVKIKNKNPYATEGEIRTYANLPKEGKKVSVGVGFGYDPINGTIKPELQLQYKLLSIF